MAVVHTQDSAFAQEMRRHEALHTQNGPPGRPYVFREFPKRMYQAGRNDQGKTVILSGQTANSEHEQRNLESRGFVDGGQGKAIEAYERIEVSMAVAAAERNYTERRMSPQAQAEAQAANESAGARHLPSVPETPIIRRVKKGWPKGKRRSKTEAPHDDAA